MGLSMPWATPDQAAAGFQVLLGDATGHPAPANETVNAIITELSYASSLGFPAPTAVQMAVAPPPEELKKQLVSLMAQHHDAIKAHKLGDGTILNILKNLPWQQILPILLQLLGGLTPTPTA